MLFLILISVIPCHKQLTAQSLEFYREDILFSLQEDVATTKAEYHFCNVGDKDIRTTLYYPLPEGTVPYTDSILILDMRYWDTIPYRFLGEGIIFGVEVAAYKTFSFSVYFRQVLQDRQFSYILTSTSFWKRPLEQANYTLNVDQALEIDSLSYMPDTVYLKEYKRVYEWHKKNFMPTQDFKVFYR